MGKSTSSAWILTLAALSCAAAAAEPITVRVVVARLEIRSSPTPQANPIATALRDDYLEVAEDAGSGWLLVRVPRSRKLGFIESRYVAVVAAPGETTGAVAPKPGATATRPAARQARAGKRLDLTLLLSAFYTPAKVTANESTTFTMNQEKGSLDTDYEFKAAVGFDATARLMLKPSIGIQAGYSRLTRDGSYTLDARLPHVLVPNRDRLLSLSGDGLSWTESAFHVDLVVARRMGKLRAAGFAGPSFFSLKADLLEKLVFEQKYPYDTGDITSKSGVAQPLSASPTGFNLGATLDMELQRHVAVGVLLRYARATAKMTRPVPAAPTVPDALAPQEVFSAPASPTQLDLGGFQLGLGARIYF